MRIDAGRCYAVPRGLPRRVLEIYEYRGVMMVRLEALRGRYPGSVTAETLDWFERVARPISEDGVAPSSAEAMDEAVATFAKST